MLNSHRLLFIPLLSAATLSLGACASVSTPAQATFAPSGEDRPSTVYGAFLAGSTALNRGQPSRATDYFLRGAALEPAAVLLKGRAFRAALESGDVRRAAGLAPAADEGSLADQRLGRLTRAVEALAENKPEQAAALLAGEPIGPPHRAAGLLLTPWAQALAGDWKAALILPDARGDRLVESVSRLNLALLLEQRGRNDLAEAAYLKLLADGNASGRYTAAYGEFLERRGRKADAAALYDAALKGDPSNDVLRQARERTVAGRPAPAPPTLLQGAALALLTPAAMFIVEKQPTLGRAYLRLALRIDPDENEAWLLLGDSLAGSGQLDAAREAYGKLKPGAADYVAAQARIVATYDQANNPSAALATAQDAVKAAPDDIAALTLLADALRSNDKNLESAKVMDTVIAREGDKAGWQLYYMRAVALSLADQWPAAERDLIKALALQPDQPEVLNFLGYSWLDRGEHLPQAKAMVEKAVAATPDSGAMVDSLGWAYYKLGDYAKAVEQLERAAELDAGDPDINNHLGDAYWKVGRRIEARFQWESVLTFNPSAKLKAEVEEKLKTNAPAEAPVKAPPPTVASR